MKERSKLSIILDYVIYWSLCLYMLDVILLGTGELTRIGGISSRMVFFAIAVLASVPGVLKNYKQYLTNKSILFVGVFMVALVLSAGLGLINGNYMPILISDVKGFLNILIVFPMVYILSEKKRTIRMLKMMLTSSFVMAVFCIALSYFMLFEREFKMTIYYWVHKMDWANLTSLSQYATRVFLHSGTRMLILGLLFAFALLILEKKRVVLRYVQMTTCLTAIFIAYARAIYLGMAVMVVAMLILIAIKYKEYFKQTIQKYAIVFVLTAVFILALGASQKSNLFILAIDRCLIAVGGEQYIDPDVAGGGGGSIENVEAELESLDVRQHRQEMSIKNFSESPIWGKGLGVVNDIHNDTIEYFYLDILSKMGVVGVLIFLAPAAFCIISIVKKKDEYEEEQRLLALVCWFALLYLIIISYFNPCMNTSWGLSIYGLTIALSIPWKKEETLCKK